MKEYKLALEIVFRLLEPWEEPETPFVGKVWDAKRCTFDGRSHWLAAIETAEGKLVTVASDEVDGTLKSAVDFCLREAQIRALPGLDIKVREN